MRVIVGLGNPGRQYAETWHNLGFMLIERLFERGGGYRFRTEMQAEIAEVSLAGERVLLVRPQTYMNLSGDAVKPLLERYGEGRAQNLVTAFDDIALPFPTIRVRARGSAGGQKGMKSIIERISSQDFPRVRMGIRPDHPVADLSGYVLSRIPKAKRAGLDEMMDRAADAVETVMREGVERAQSLFNERVAQDGEKQS